ncbi:hypothetical protein Pmani_004227 [Petrolisthes manimaculis]|uniref:Uncharacterized protein n=1 Tax=Petrolisthes manimaculis TaxID=1843537 RepID=A0AAE1ULN2_9EUCA|nr:hypothetical protein Pmani_004227 [Petrolisthes manimaculis]
MVVCFGSLLVTAHKYQRVEDFDQRVIVKKCDETYTILAGQCYKFHQNRCNWDTACQVCQSEGAQLASPQ